MQRFFAPLVLASVSFFLAAQPVSAVTIAWSPVGNPGNATDPATGSLYGAVPYAYNIGTYDVTASQYVEFLNAKDADGTNSLLLYKSNTTYGGISFNAGNANGSKYGVILGRGNQPVNYTTWYDAIRFANWLNNGQGNGDMETGAYTLLHDGSPTPTPIPSNGQNITRNAGATVFLPSEDEWYKAAFYNPGSNSYFQFPTSSNLAPTASSPTALPNHVNTVPGGPGDLTDVGAYTGTTSPYGAFDMAGDVYQWNEALIGSSRGLRVGSFKNSSSQRSSNRNYSLPSDVESVFGFRMAAVFEAPFPGDTNGDHVVDFTDLGILLNHFNQAGTFSSGDFNGSDTVDFDDLGILLNNYNQHAPVSAAAAAVPEPSTLALAAFGAFGLLIAACRKR